MVKGKSKKVKVRKENSGAHTLNANDQNKSPGKSFFYIFSFYLLPFYFVFLFTVHRLLTP